MNSHKSKKPVDKRISVTGWAYEKRTQAMEALRIAKSQNTNFKFVTASERVRQILDKSNDRVVETILKEKKNGSN